MTDKVKDLRREKRQREQDILNTKRINDQITAERVSIKQKYYVYVRQPKGKLLKRAAWSQTKNNVYWKNQAVNEVIETEKLRYRTRIRWAYMIQVRIGTESPIVFADRNASVVKGRATFERMRSLTFPKIKIKFIKKRQNILRNLTRTNNEFLKPNQYRVSENEGIYRIQDIIGSRKIRSIIRKKFEPIPYI